MTLSEPHIQIVLKALEQVPPNWRNQYADNVVDALFGIADLDDNAVRAACKAVADKMQINVRVQA